MKKRRQPIHVFYQQLASLLQAHLSLKQAIEFCQINMVQWESIQQHLLVKISNGAKLFEALADYPMVFSDLDRQYIAIGEKTGQLPTVLIQLADMKQRWHRTKSQLRGALFYPLTILVVAILIAVGLLWLVVPQFAQLFASFGTDLPWPTAMLLTLSQSLHQHSIAILVFSSLLVGVHIMLWRHHLSYKKCWQKIGLSMPIIKLFSGKSQRVFWSRGFLLASNVGFDSLSAFRLANLSMGLVEVSGENKLRQGASLVGALATLNIFDQSQLQLLKVGEAAGQVTVVLKTILETSEQQLSDGVMRLLKMIEPVVMLLVALLVGSFIVALYLPIFTMGSLF